MGVINNARDVKSVLLVGLAQLVRIERPHERYRTASSSVLYSTAIYEKANDVV